MFTTEQIITWAQYHNRINEQRSYYDPSSIESYKGLLSEMSPSEIESVVKMALLHNDLYVLNRRDRSKELLYIAATLVGGMIHLIAQEMLEKMRVLSFNMSDLAPEEVDNVFNQVESTIKDFENISNVLKWYANNISGQTVIRSHIHRQCVRHAIFALKNFK